MVSGAESCDETGLEQKDNDRRHCPHHGAPAQDESDFASLLSNEAILTGEHKDEMRTLAGGRAVDRCWTSWQLCRWTRPTRLQPGSALGRLRILYGRAVRCRRASNLCCKVPV